MSGPLDLAAVRIEYDLRPSRYDQVSKVVERARGMIVIGFGVVIVLGQDDSVWVMYVVRMPEYKKWFGRIQAFEKAWIFCAARIVNRKS